MRTRILFDILMLTIVFLLSFTGIYYVLHKLFAVSMNSIIYIFIPTSIVSIAAIAYGYSVGAKRHYTFSNVNDGPRAINLFSLFLSGTLSLICMVVGMYLCLASKIYDVGIILVLAGTFLSIFALKKVTHSL